MSDFDAGTMIGEGGSLTEAFHENVAGMLGDGYEDFKGFGDYKDFPALLKGAADTKRALHAKTEGMVKLPTAESSDEDLTAYREITGVPPSADKYEFTRRELPEGMAYDEESMNSFKELFHSKNVSNEAAQEFVTAFDAYETAKEEKMVTMLAEQQVTDDKAANDAFDAKHKDQSEAVRKASREAMAALEFTPVVEALKARFPGIENSPEIADWIVGKVVPKMKPGQHHDGSSGGEQMSGEEATLREMYPVTFAQMEGKQ